MNDRLKVGTPVDKRSDEERAAAAPVSLPAGSYDGEKLNVALEDVKPKDGETEEQARERIIAEHNETEFHVAELGVPPGYKRVEVENVDLGIVEQRVVYDESQAEEAAREVGAGRAIQPGSKPLENEQRFDVGLVGGTVADLSTGLESIVDVQHLNALREAEVSGQNRSGALTALDSRIAAVQSGGSGTEGE